MSILTTIAVFDAPIALVGNTKATTLYVNSTGSGGAYLTIQDAVNASADGGTVYVYNGTYFEHVIVNKSINLIGKDRNTTIIEGNGSADVLRIDKNWVNITGFTITGSGSSISNASVKFSNVQNCTFINNNVSSNNSSGIIIESSSSNIFLFDNYVTNNTIGLKIDSSFNNIIYNNNLSGNDIGIESRSSSKNNISGNIVSFNNENGILFLASSINNTIANNILENNSYSGINITESSNFNHISNNNVSNNTEGIILDLSINNTIFQNYVINSYYGISLYDADGNTISNNTLYNNSRGIRFWYSDQNNIIGNTANGNFWNGIILRYSDFNNIVENNASENRDGIEIEGSIENNVSKNLAFWNIYHGIFFWRSDDCIVKQNYASFNGQSGIFLTDSFRNLVVNNVAEDNLNGIWITNSEGNIVTGNSYSNNRRGMDISDSNGNTISYNKASANDWGGIELWNSNNNNITNNDILDNGVGIILVYSDMNNISNNIAQSNTNYGMGFYYSNKNNITGNYASNSTRGFVINTSFGNNVFKNDITNNLWGIHLEVASNNTIDNCNIYSNSIDGVNASDGAQDNYIVNSTISDSGSYDIILYGNSSINAINTSFNKSKVYFEKPDSRLIVKWFMHVYVESVYGGSISGANVEIKNLTNDPVEGSPFMTDNDGFVRWIIATEYIQNDTNGGNPGGNNKIYSTPHNVSAYFMGETGYAEPVMDISKVIIVSIDVELPAADAGSDALVYEDELYVFDGSGSGDIVNITNWTWNFGDGSYGYVISPNHTYTLSMIYVVELNVSWSNGKWDTNIVNITVNNVPPTADAGGDKVADEGEIVTFNGGNSSDTASDLSNLVYTWDFGDGTNGTGKITNHTYDDNGIFIVKLQVTDDDGSISYDEITVLINNILPIVMSMPPQYLIEDQFFTLQINATDVIGDTFIFSDNTSMFDIDPITGNISFTPTNSDVGNHSINITVMDDDGGEGDIEIKFNIQNTNDGPFISSTPLLDASEDILYYYDVNATDIDIGDTLNFSLDVAPPGMSIDAATGLITWTPNNSQVGNHIVIVNATDSFGLFAIQEFLIEVKNVNDAPELEDIGPVTITEDETFTLIITAYDIDQGDELKFSDNTELFDIDPLTGNITFIPSNDDVGIHTVTITVTDSEDANDSRIILFTIVNVNDLPTIDPVVGLTAEVGEAFNYIISADDIDLDDQLTYSDDSYLFKIDPISGEISFIPDQNDLGEHSITITVTDSEGASVQATFTLTINEKEVEPPKSTTDYSWILWILILGIIIIVIIYFMMRKKKKNLPHEEVSNSEETEMEFLEVETIDLK